MDLGNDSEESMKDPDKIKQITKEISGLHDKDESGIVEDFTDTSLNITDTNLNAYQSYFSNLTSCQGTNGASTEKDQHVSTAEHDLNFVARKKDDSGVFSEKSPNCACPKDITLSDGDFSESISESLDDMNNIVTKAVDLNTNCETCEELKGKVNNISEHNSNSCKERSKELKSNESKSDKKISNILVPKINTDKVTPECENQKLSKQTETKFDISCSVSNADDSISDNVQHTDMGDDTGSQNEDEMWCKFMENAGKKKSSARRLVDYEDSDSEPTNDIGPSLKVYASRNYRKRKSDSDDEESDEENKTTKSSEDDEVNNADGTPLLISHSAIDPGIQVDDTEPGLDSDDDSEEDYFHNLCGNTKSSSESEEEADMPMDVSSFGPPQHKWKAVFDLRQREFGYRSSTEAGYFRKRVQGSLQMVQRFDLQCKMDHHEGCVNALHFNSNGTLLASGSDDLNIVIWNWIRNKPTLVYDSGHRSNVFQAKFMPFSGDCHVVSCARDGQIRLADLSSTGVCKATKKVAQHRGAAHKLALETSSAHIVLSCGEDAVTYQMDLREEKPTKLVTTKENDKKVAMYSIHSNPTNCHEFCLGGRDHLIRLYDKRKINEEVNNGLLKSFAPHHIMSTEKKDIKANVTCACYNYNGTEVLGTYNDEDIYLFSNEHSDGADFIHRYRGHRNNQTVKGVNFYGPESEFIVSGSDCGHIFLWDKATENIVQYMDGDVGGVINVLEPHPFAPVLATSGLDHDVKIWAPSAESPTKLKGLRKLAKQNLRDRDEERVSDGGMVDGSMLWFIMNQLRRGRRRREREVRDDADDDSSNTSSDDNTTQSDTDSDAGPQERLQCNPS